MFFALAVVAAVQTMPSAPTESSNDDVVVVGSRESFKLNTRALRAGQSAFLKNREAFAPQASLRFLVERRDGTKMGSTSIRLYFTDGTNRVAVPISPDNSFDLSGLPAGDWWLESNLPRRSVRIDALVRSPGSTPYDYRFGDGRLQCRVSWTMLKANVPILAAPLVGVVEAAGPCSSRKMGLYTVTPRPIRTAEISEAGRSTSAWVGKQRRSYRLPMGDDTLGNEAKVKVTME
jgi:hypothetical protein